MKIKRKGEVVWLIRNKKKGLRLIVRKDINTELPFPCQECYFWNHPFCREKPCGKIGLFGSYHFIKDR